MLRLKNPNLYRNFFHFTVRPISEKFNYLILQTMKKAGIIILFITIIINGFSQNISAESQTEKKEANKANENETSTGYHRQ